MKIEKALRRLGELRKRSTAKDKEFLLKTRQSRGIRSVVRRFRDSVSRAAAPTGYGITGVIISGDLKGIHASTCKLDPSTRPINGRVAVRLLDGPRRAEVIQIFPRDFSPIRGKKRKPHIPASNQCGLKPLKLVRSKP